MTKESILKELDECINLHYKREEDRLELKSLKGIREAALSGRPSYICYPNSIYTDTFNKARFENVAKRLKEKGFYAIIRRTVNDEVYLEVYLEAPKVLKRWSTWWKEVKKILDE